MTNEIFKRILLKVLTIKTCLGVSLTRALYGTNSVNFDQPQLVAGDGDPSTDGGKEDNNELIQ